MTYDKYGASLALGLLAVFLTIRQPPEHVPCPPRMVPAATVKNADGTYTHIPEHDAGRGLAVACMRPGQTWIEEWTDYPDKGGEFVRRVTAPEPVLW